MLAETNILFVTNSKIYIFYVLYYQIIFFIQMIFKILNYEVFPISIFDQSF